MTAYARPFRLHLRHSQILDGAEFPNGRVIVVDDPEWGLCSGARSADLLHVCYPGSRIEWPPAEHCGHQAPNAVSGYGLLTECVLRPGHDGSHADEHGMRWWLTTLAEERPATAEESPC